MHAEIEIWKERAADLKRQNDSLTIDKMELEEFIGSLQKRIQDEQVLRLKFVQLLE